MQKLGLPDGAPVADEELRLGAIDPGAELAFQLAGRKLDHAALLGDCSVDPEGDGAHGDRRSDTRF
jgi:hypothetical protein